MLLGPHPALVIQSVLMHLLLGVCLDQTFVQLSKHVLRSGLGLGDFCPLVLMNVSLCRLVEPFQELLVRFVLLDGRFVFVVAIAFLVDF